MKYIDEYRDKKIVSQLVNEIKRITTREYTFMEVCGSHTMAIQKFGIPSLLPASIHLISGPGCPVCVTCKTYINKAIKYSKRSDFIVATYGDLLRVPGSYSSLEKMMGEQGDIRIVYSPLDALNIARENADKKVIFLAVGFETTAPGTAVAVDKAKAEGLQNFFVFSAHKTMPPAMDAIIDEGVNISGYLCPGHVSTITGSAIYEHIPQKFGLPCVISGFEPVDILQSILLMIRQIEDGTPSVEIQYKRVVLPEGNKKALAYMNQVFEARDDYWRGMGVIRDSGLKLREAYHNFDCEYHFPLQITSEEEDRGCICGEILKGLKNPLDCTLFARKCTPFDPVGACMVSAEGTCQAYFKYKQYEQDYTKSR